MRTPASLSTMMKRSMSMQMPPFQKTAPGQALKDYSTDLTQMALDGKLEYVHVQYSRELSVVLVLEWLLPF